MDEENTGGVVGWVQSHLTLISIAVAGLVLGVAFLRRPQNTTSTPQPQGDFSGLETDANGNHIIYKHASDTFITISKVLDSYNTSATSTVTNNPAMPIPSAPPAKPTSPSAPVEHPIESHPTKPSTPVKTTTPKHTVMVGIWPLWNGSLSGIAQHEYGDANKWHVIYEANRAKIGNNPDLIFPGTVLTIP